MSTRKSVKSAYAVSSFTGLQDLSRRARNMGRKTGQFVVKMWQALGSGPHWAWWVCWAMVAACSCLLIVDIILNAYVSAFFAVLSILCGTNYLRLNRWWK